MEKNLTRGNVFATIVTFALPYLLSYFLQTLYGMADLFIAGQFIGVDGITAVANGSQVLYMLTVVIVGLAMGSTVTIGRAVGANRLDNAARAIGNTITLFAGIAIVLTVVLLAGTHGIVVLIGTPAEAVEGTTQYLLICFAGVPFIVAYNIISSIFRGLGDSTSPMVFIAVACACNIALDYLFMGHFQLGPAGAALGTTLAQTISVIVALAAIRHKRTGISLSPTDLKPHRDMLGGILTIGVPTAVQDGCIQIAFIIITVIANYRGLDTAAAVGVVEKVISALFLVPSSMLATVSAVSAQNIGAGKPDRAVKTLAYATAITVTYGIIISIVVELTACPIVGLFTSDATVITLGVQYIRSYIIDAIFAGIHFCFSGFFAAWGRSYIGFIHNIIAISLVRVPGAYLASKLFPDTLFPMGIAAPAGSLLPYSSASVSTPGSNITACFPRTKPHSHARDYTDGHVSTAHYSA